MNVQESSARDAPKLVLPRRALFVPPPQPVLPASAHELDPSAGRRYSASMEPYEFAWAAPRRSALTVPTPPEADWAAPRRSALTVPTPPEAECNQPPTPTPTPATPRKRRGLRLLTLAVVAAMCAMAAFVALWLPSRLQQSAAQPPDAGSPAEQTPDPLLTPRDAALSAVSDRGWLQEADLPLVNPGDGVWQATKPTSVLTVTGSGCEPVSLTSVTGATAKQRTLLLVREPREVVDFGVDQVTYTFEDTTAAKAYRSRLERGLAACAKLSPTSTVTKGPDVTSAAAGPAGFSGSSYEITHQTAEGEPVSYRVAVLRQDKQVVYLMANPTADLDFTDAQWKAIMRRAGDRAGQQS